VVAEVLDVAGVAVAVQAIDPVRAAMAALVTGGFGPSIDRPTLTLVVDDRRVPAPSTAARQEQFGARLWVEGDGITIAASGIVGTVEGPAMALHVPDRDAAAAVEVVLPVLLAWALADHGRFLVHGAAVAHGDEAVLVLGSSGSGKSTLAAAAIEAGWQALADDLVVLEPCEGGLAVHGIHRAPAVPVEIGGPLVGRGARPDDPRARAELPRSLLRRGGWPVVATVLVAHSPTVDGQLDRVGPERVVAALLQSFVGTLEPARRARCFAFGRRLASIPAWRLGHPSDAPQRRDFGASALAEVLRRDPQ
jgi:hypothetical protein